MNEASFIGYGPNGEELFDRPPQQPENPEERTYPISGTVRGVYGGTDISLDAYGLPPELVKVFARPGFEGVSTINIQASPEEAASLSIGNQVQLRGVHYINGRLITEAALDAIDTKEAA